MAHYYLIYILIPLLAGALLDFLFGDPLGRFHPVVLIGRLISRVEQHYYRAQNRRKAGMKTVVIVCVFSVLIPAALIAGLSAAAGLFSSTAGRIVCCTASALLCWQMLAGGSLEKESMKVYDALWDRTDLSPAREAVSMIVGRDTKALDEPGIIRAAVETVAENTSDGVIAPMLFMAVLGIPGIMLYKAVNTMDSMIGYKNEKYLDFGWAAARTDDVLNFLPARISGLALVLGAFLHRECDGRHAMAVFRSDRRKSSSPNAGCGEAAVAGALHVQLMGPASYFGVRQEKPFIGMDDRPVEREDIRIAGDLMYMASGITLLAVTGIFLIFSAF